MHQIENISANVFCLHRKSFSEASWLQELQLFSGLSTQYQFDFNQLPNRPYIYTWNMFDAIQVWKHILKMHFKKIIPTTSYVFKDQVYGLLLAIHHGCVTVYPLVYA